MLLNLYLLLDKYLGFINGYTFDSNSNDLMSNMVPKKITSYEHFFDLLVCLSIWQAKWPSDLKDFPVLFKITTSW